MNQLTLFPKRPSRFGATSKGCLSRRQHGELRKDALLERSPKESDLRLQILAMKGDIEFQYDLPAAEKTWTEVRDTGFAAGRAVWESCAAWGALAASLF